jgi:hypothetical protein
MATPAALRAIALALEQAHEEPHFERTSFRVGKKIFATMTANGSEAMVKVAPPEKLEALLASKPKVFFGYGGWTTKGGALGVRLDAIEPELLKELVVASHAQIATKTRAKTKTKPKAKAKRPTAKKSTRR